MVYWILFGDEKDYIVQNEKIIRNVAEKITDKTQNSSKVVFLYRWTLFGLAFFRGDKSKIDDLLKELFDDDLLLSHYSPEEIIDLPLIDLFRTNGDLNQLLPHLNAYIKRIESLGVYSDDTIYRSKHILLFLVQEAGWFNSKDIVLEEELMNWLNDIQNKRENDMGFTLPEVRD